MAIFHDRRTDEYRDVSPEALYGRGEEGFKQLFPGEQATALAPWQRAGGLKRRAPYEVAKVHDVLLHPDRPQMQIDPRNLRSTQPEVTRGGVRHYMSEEYEKLGKLYADREKLGNIRPVVYGRTHPVTGEVENLILSGHHRATAALLRGKPLMAHFVEGGYGAER